MGRGIPPRPIKKLDFIDLKFGHWDFNEIKSLVESQFGPNSFEWSFGDNSSKQIRGLETVTHGFPADGSYKISLKLLDSRFCNNQDSYDSTLIITFNTKAVVAAENVVCLIFSLSLHPN